MTDAVQSNATQQRRLSVRQEFATQAQLVAKLQELLDPGVTFFSALENRPRSFLAGLFQKKLGVRAGLPDLIFVVSRRPPVFIEMKGKRGVPSPVQRRVFADLKAKGADVYVARSVGAAIEALRRSNVPFRRPHPPRQLEPWEGPFTDLNRRMPQEPGVRALRREAQRRYRERQRARKERGDAAGDDLAA
jgi:hypothetical protein